MNVEDCAIEGLKIIHLDMKGDNRGFFVERFSKRDFENAGLPTDFIQDNHSRSAPGVLRGLHYQHTPAMGKLVGVTRGRIFDVAVDIRRSSKTFGQHHALELSEGVLFWMPSGFAHGFCVIGDEPADVVYKVDALYNAAGEGGIAPYDEQLAIDWPVKNATLSVRDQSLPSWDDFVAKGF